MDSQAKKGKDYGRLLDAVRKSKETAGNKHVRVSALNTDVGHCAVKVIIPRSVLTKKLDGPK